MGATKGLYVCMVTAYPSFTESHAISVDCNSNPKMIYDCEEITAMEYKMENFHVCSGPNSQFLSIAHIEQIIV